MAFWVRRNQVSTFYISDLGYKGVDGGGGEADLHESFSYDEIQSSAALAAAFISGDLVKLDGPGGSVVPSGQEYNDAVIPHALNATSIHTGLLEIAQLRRPIRTLTVGSQGCDYTTIKAAVDAAISGGAGAATPWGITVHPGTYAEDPMTIQSGIALSALYPNRMDTVFVTANNSAADLFTCTGGYISGFRVSGVTDASYSLFKMATANTLTVLHGVSLRGCSTGIAISNGASVVATNFSAQITGTGQAITNAAISITGLNSYLGMVGGFFSAPSALLPGYATNPIQTALRVADQSRIFVVGATFKIANKDTTADTILADGGSLVNLLAGEISNCYRVARIGSSGTGTTVVVQGCSLFGNTINGQCDSSTGVFLISVATDDFKLNAVAGSKLSGVVQSTDQDRTYLAGPLSYRFNTGKIADLADYFADFSTTGVCEGGEVTAGTGLNVDVAAGDAWVRREADGDTFWVEWAADTVALTASTTNYVYYDSVTEALVSAGSAPGEEGVLLATVVTDGSGIRFLHNTRNVVNGPWDRLHQYLLDTRKRALKSGLGVTAGTGGRQFSIGSGTYYIALNPLSYAGATDATFSYFYGTNGATEVSGQTQVSNTQYDNAGTLTAMTAGYYRSDTVILTSDGRVSVIYGTAEYSTQQLAEESSVGNTPTFLDSTSFPLARLIVQEAGNIVSFIDIRPQPATGGGGSAGGVTVHSALSGLNADDHVQYLLTTGARAMTGALNMGGYAITSVGNVDGVDVSDHSARHDPGGVDALTTATPTAVLVGAAAAEGTAASFARSDHQHGIGSGIPSSVGTANAAGTSSSVARLDHVHDHGSQTSGTLHAVATTSVAGFMSASDKTTLDHLTLGHVEMVCRNESGADIPKATLVATAGWSATYGCPFLAVADKDTASLRPAFGVTHELIANNSNGLVLLSGVLDGVDTSMWANTDQLVLGSSGAFSRPPPEQSPFTGEVQNVGSVLKVHATEGLIVFNPDGMEIMTANQFFAAGGTNGTPGPTNKFVTDSDPRNTNARTPTAHATTHDLGAADGLTARQLAWFLDEGPAEGFLSGAYKEITGGVFPTSVIWYDNNGVGKKKIVEKTINRNPNQTPSSIVWKIYDASEVLIRTITDTFTYSSGVFESSRLRTVV